MHRYKLLLFVALVGIFSFAGKTLAFQLNENTRSRDVKRAVTRIESTVEEPQQVDGECSVPVGHYDYCRLCGPCGSGQGDCDSDAECGSGLTCAADIGPEFDLGLFVDVCVAQDTCPVEPGHMDFCALCGPCGAEQGDCDSTDECSEGLTCQADVGNTYDWWWNVDVCADISEDCPLDKGDPDYCAVCGPCGEEEGDCDSDAECESDLFCFSNVGSQYGFDYYTDVCLNVAADECPVDPGHLDYCSLCGPCEENDGDCDGEEDCESGLICVNNLGYRFGYGASIDVCMAPVDLSSEGTVCPVNKGHYDYCILCGPCEEDSGDCDSDEECSDNTVCKPDIGEFYGWAEDVDVCRIDGETECPEEIGSENYCSVCGDCDEGEGDCDSHDECSGDLLCVANVGEDYGFGKDVSVCLAECPVPLGHPDYCTMCGPCEDGEGNCKSDSDCAADLACLADVGKFVGLPPETDICVGSGTCTATLGEYAFCSACGPCAEGEGDCDNDSECETGLVCINEVGPDFGFAWDVDVCLPVSEEECAEMLGEENYCEVCGPCEAEEGDCNTDEDCAEGLFCVSNIGDEYGFDATVDVCLVRGADECAELVGDWDYCRFCGPCEENEGDCDTDAECRVGLTCVDDIGADFGLEPGVDICQVNEECPELEGDNIYCSVCGPCGEEQGDCDNDNECSEGLICVNNLGSEFGWSWETDVCLKPNQDTCPVPVGHYDYCALCGPCTEGEGDCDTDNECQSGLSCRQDIGALFGFPSDVDVCQAETNSLTTP